LRPFYLHDQINAGKNRTRTRVEASSDVRAGSLQTYGGVHPGQPDNFVKILYSKLVVVVARGSNKDPALLEDRQHNTTKYMRRDDVYTRLTYSGHISQHWLLRDAAGTALRVRSTVHPCPNNDTKPPPVPSERVLLASSHTHTQRGFEWIVN
jgi:hypothetical protein